MKQPVVLETVSALRAWREAERKAGAARTTPFEGGAALKALMK